jgi:hypothetical protein
MCNDFFGNENFILNSIGTGIGSLGTWENTNVQVRDRIKGLQVPIKGKASTGIYLNLKM